MYIGNIFAQWELDEAREDTVVYAADLKFKGNWNHRLGGKLEETIECVKVWGDFGMVSNRLAIFQNRMKDFGVEVEVIRLYPSESHAFSGAPEDVQKRLNAPKKILDHILGALQKEGIGKDD